MLTTASCGLMYGAINTTKTTNLGRIARYLYEKFGLTSRLITADNEFDTLKDLIEAGVIEHWAIKAIPNPWPVMTKLSRGYWPVFVNGKMMMAPTPPEVMSKIGAYLIEGTTTIGELLHADHINKGRSIGEDVVGRFNDTVETSDGLETINYAKSARSHYQSVQDFVTFNLIPDFSMLPIKWVWWTGHEYAGEDEATGQARLGPGIVGKAAVMRVPRVIGNTFHMVAAEIIAPNKPRVLERRAHFEPHADSYQKMQTWPAGVKIPVEHMQEWQRAFPQGYIPLELNKGMEQYLAFHHEINKKRQKLVIVPGTEPYPEMKFEAPTSGLPPSVTPQVQNIRPPVASQTAPPPRPGFRRPPMAPPPRIVPKAPGPVAVPPTLEQQLVKSIEQQTGQPVVVPEPESTESNALPDINAVPAAQIKIGE